LNAETVVIGATATPTRTGNQVSLDEFYTDLVEEVRISELIAQGYLAKPNTYGIKLNLDAVKIKGGEYDADSLGDFLTRNKVFEGVYENYSRLTPNKKAIIFAPNIESSRKLVRELAERGLPIKHLDGETPSAERSDTLNWFKSTPNALLSNVGILTAGFDEPTIEVVILYRATKSLSLFLQMVGRGSRTTATKSEFTILDFGNNVYTHGFWESDREWSLKKAEKSEGIAPVKNCPNCSAILPASLQVCEYCGTELPKTQRELEEALNVELSKITAQDVARFIQIRDFDKLEEFAHFKGYKKSWVHFRIKYEDIEAYAQHKGFNPAWVRRIKELRNYK
jgi:superfamily II DNA or RNA helicase